LGITSRGSVSSDQSGCCVGIFDTVRYAMNGEVKQSKSQSTVNF
jgi:hypothetical protein